MCLPLHDGCYDSVMPFQSIPRHNAESTTHKPIPRLTTSGKVSLLKLTILRDVETDGRSGCRHRLLGVRSSRKLTKS